jgi:hypothetical protein
MKELEHKNKNTGNNQQPTEQMIADRLARARVEAGSRFAEACDWRWYVSLCASASISYPIMKIKFDLYAQCQIETMAMTMISNPRGYDYYTPNAHTKYNLVKKYKWLYSQ